MNRCRDGSDVDGKGIDGKLLEVWKLMMIVMMMMMMMIMMMMTLHTSIELQQTLGKNVRPWLAEVSHDELTSNTT